MLVRSEERVQGVYCCTRETVLKLNLTALRRLRCAHTKLRSSIAYCGSSSTEAFAFDGSKKFWTATCLCLSAKSIAVSPYWLIAFRSAPHRRSSIATFTRPAMAAAWDAYRNRQIESRHISTPTSWLVCVQIEWNNGPHHEARCRNLRLSHQWPIPELGFPSWWRP